MAIVYELAWHGDTALLDRFQPPLQRLLGLPGLTALDLYRPASGRALDPYVDDGPGPLGMAMLEFADLAALRAALERDVPLLGMSAIDLGAGQITFTGQPMERHFFPVAGETMPGPLRAAFSYVVRYYLPADDAPEFRRWYMANLPPLQASLPGIRGVMSYVPLADAPAGAPSPGYLIGNEVAFEDIAAFNRAMASKAREVLRRRSRDLPTYSGRSTHFPMQRTRLLG